MPYTSFPSVSRSSIWKLLAALLYYHTKSIKSSGVTKSLQIRVLLLSLCADSRFAEPRISLWEGFNFVGAKPLLRRAESRFGKPRSSRKGDGFILFACTKRTKSTPEVCEPLDSGDDSNLRSIHDFCGNDRPSSCNRPRRALQGFRVSPVRIWIGAKGLP